MLKFFKKKKDKSASLEGGSKKAASKGFYPVVVKEVRRETADAVSLVLELAEEHRGDFAFIPGQYLTLKATINGEEVRRSYSICTAPSEGELCVAVKEIPDGKFSTYANRVLKAGDQLETMAPTGGFTWTPKGDGSHYVGWAAGSGITPIMSIVKTVMAQEPASKFTLFYGNRNSNSIIFKEGIEDLKNANMDRFEVHYVLSQEDQGADSIFGRIDGDKAKTYNGKFFEAADVADHYLCGPQGMIESVSTALEGMGTAKDNVHFELFHTDTSAAASGKEVASVDGSKVTVILDGDETHFELSGKDNILDAALAAGADAPFACKGAVCCTCKAKVIEGSAEMTMNYALVDEEVKDGYILTCQSHATSPTLKVSFDE